jgi:photosystem II stability/assembly factor-like uncharacterized protein
MKYIPILLLLIATSANAQWHRLPSPPAAGPNQVAASPDNKHVYAATSDGIWHAANIDGPWSRFSLQGQNINSVQDFLFAGQGDVFFAATDTALLRSIDTGKTWKMILHRRVTAVVQDNLNITVAATGDTVNAVLRSSDLGQSWKTLAAAPPGGFAFVSFFAAPNYYFAGSGQEVLWRLPRSGGSWQMTNYPDREILSSTSYQNNIFAGALGKIYISTDFGASWIEPLGYGLDTSNDFLDAIAVNGLTIVAATFDGLVVSTDGGRNWTHTLRESDINGLSFTAGNFLISTASGLYASADGFAWHFVAIPTQAFTINDIVNSNGYLFARTTFAVYQSSDRGQSWMLANGPKGIWNLRKSGDAVLALAPQTIWRWRPDLHDSTGPGSWDSIATSRSIGYGGAATIGDKFFFADGIHSIYRSGNQGMSWDNLQFPGEMYTSSMFTNADTLFVVSNEDHWNLYASTDLGMTWSKRHVFPETGGTFSSLTAAVGSQMALSFYESFGNQDQTSGPRFYHSNDFGRTWTLDSVDVSALSVIGNSILAGSNSTGTFYNLSNGRTFRIGDSIARSFLAIASDDSLLYVGTSGQGIWMAALVQLPLAVRAEHQLATLPLELYPNPARAKSTLRFTLPQRGDIRLDIFNELGATVLTQDLGVLEAGQQKIFVTTSQLLNGVYSVRASSDTFSATGKLVVSH